MGPPLRCFLDNRIVAGGPFPRVPKVGLCQWWFNSGIIKLLAKYEDDPVALRQAGIEYACNQLVDLGRHGVNGLHVYAMNQPDIACAAAEAVAAAGLR